MDYRNYPPYGYGQMPYYPAYPYPVDADVDEEEQMERDMEYLKSMYPDMAKRIQAYVDDACDKMEYEGSMMFDEYPDRVTLRKIGNDIYDQMNNVDTDTDMDMEPAVPAEEDMSAEGMYTMNYRNNRGMSRNDRNDPVRNLIDVILFNEMHKRRCRFNRCRRRLYW